MSLQPNFSIITVSKGRLDHLRRSLPRMLAQSDSEVIVVDYSCPQDTREFVQAEFPTTKIVSVGGEPYFSNWKARNAGAAAATGRLLLFCDADTILADTATASIKATLPAKSFGSIAAMAGKRGIAANQLNGLQLVPAADFRRVGGYDEVLAGYAAGGDVDLGDRLRIAGLDHFTLDPGIVDSVIEHGDAERMAHHRDSIETSYAAGLLYRAAKYYIQRLLDPPDVPLEKRQQLYQAARDAAKRIDESSGPIAIDIEVDIDVHPVGMPRQLGFARGKRTVSLKVELSLEERLAREQRSD